MDPVDFKDDVLDIILKNCPAAFENVLEDEDTETENPNKNNKKASETDGDIKTAEKEGQDDTQDANENDKNASKVSGWFILVALFLYLAAFAPVSLFVGPRDWL